MSEVSVCMPTYNGERFLAASIESVLKQEFQDFEFIIVDDASTDNTVDIVQSFKDNRIRFYRNEVSMGIPGNWNLTLRRAASRYVKFAFQDDILYPDCISTMLQAIKSHNTVGMVFSRRDLIEEDDIRAEGFYVYFRDLQEPIERKHPMTGFIDGRAFLATCIKKGGLFFNYIAEPSFVLFDAGLLPRIGYFNNKLRQNVDYEYWLRILMVSDAYFVEKPLGAFRLHQRMESQSVNTTWAKARQLWEERVIIESLRTMAKQENATRIVALLDSMQRWYFAYRLPYVIRLRLTKMVRGW